MAVFISIRLQFVSQKLAFWALWKFYLSKNGSVLLLGNFWKMSVTLSFGQHECGIRNVVLVVVVAQLAERSLPTPEVRGSNLVIGKLCI